MHVLATQLATLDEADAAVDLAQSPGEIVVLSFSDSDLSALAAAWRLDSDLLPTLRLASLKKLRHPMSVDLYVEQVISQARLVIVRGLGGLDYWRYGFERIADAARDNGVLLAALPGDDRSDPRLVAVSTLASDRLERLDGYFRAGGAANLRQALRYAASLLGRDIAWLPPEPVGPLTVLGAADDVRPMALVVFYRANLMAADIAPVTALMQALDARGLAPLGVAVSSLKDPAAATPLEALLRERKPAIVLNTTAFSAMRDDDTTVLDGAGVPVLQVVLSGSAREAWDGSLRGLAPADLAMNVVLPELDGRLLTRAISFKAEAEPDAALEFSRVHHEPEPDRIDYVARLAAAWAKLGATPAQERRLALVLSDYPARGGRTGYAVGLDTPASVVGILRLLCAEGYDVGGLDWQVADVERLLAGDADWVDISLDRYRRWLSELPGSLQGDLAETWGEASEGFRLPVLRCGKVMVLLQPDRGTVQDRKTGYHDMNCPPRHAYVALYAWLREQERIDAMIHLGTHGTLEWLPGKALALSAGCWPEAVLGPLPVIYPFIVNNPGEAVQAKRRLGAVTIGHLTPPLSAAGLHGALAEMEAIIEEYAAADGLDSRRLRHLEEEIVERAWSGGLAAECGLVKDEPSREAVAKLDAHLCDIKELSIREGLHVYGTLPDEAKIAQLAATMGGEDAPIRLSAVRERAGLLAALAGRRVAPGPAGAPTRGRADVLPTGRNLTSIDPRAIPTRTAAAIGARSADEVVRRYLQDHGEPPRALVIDLWASASLRTGGDDLAQALAYLGVRPVWDAASSRVTGIEVMPLATLDRPRIDATLRISGLFRDIFETQIALFDMAVRRVAELDEPDEDNPLAAARRAGADLSRIFGAAPGNYGAQAGDVALDGAWKTQADLGEIYLAAVTHAYGGVEPVREAGPGFRSLVSTADLLVHPQDDRERDVLDGDGVADFAGGFAAAAALLGNAPELYHLDTSDTAKPRARRLAEEIARIVRGRLTNPRWIQGMLSHGHRGVAEIAQSVDALYAFAATAEIVPGPLFDATHAALIANEAVLDAMAARNPAAVAAIAARLRDALDRGLWMTRRNAVERDLTRAIGLARPARPVDEGPR
ncbi:cobaltochelatase subunit CobN [Reyranella sp. MMS21-HV4-11]|uniref:Cobaltochelatase subunit CobN n=1 Tax=Reyranella humidisoli TaxID=2849149 RepID=A0ABS6ID50_9HYPH|nr:cobaltochelatase subunit CobN [Reyranella sp. MMS21-HV4-11]MBU8872527.1 cobaltochelatase subunit CobN [Reyranella sp. MMS21-HV4-11]